MTKEDMCGLRLGWGKLTGVEDDKAYSMQFTAGNH